MKFKVIKNHFNSYETVYCIRHPDKLAIFWSDSSAEKLILKNEIIILKKIIKDSEPEENKK
jgi:hypothetical protein